MQVTTDEKGIAVLSMGRGPVNSLNKEFIEELNSNLTSVATEARGLVLTSSLPSVFCAGLEITEMHKPDLDRLRQFWSSLQVVIFCILLYKTEILFLNSSKHCSTEPVDHSLQLPYPHGGRHQRPQSSRGLPAGHVHRLQSHAGGSPPCPAPLHNSTVGTEVHHRVKRDPARNCGSVLVQGDIELNCGVLTGVGQDTMLNTVGQRQTELALMLGTLFTAQQALDIGMVDKVVETREECSAAAYGVVAQLARYSTLSYLYCTALWQDPLRGPTHEQDADAAGHAG